MLSMPRAAAPGSRPSPAAAYPQSIDACAAAGWRGGGRNWRVMNLLGGRLVAEVSQCLCCRRQQVGLTKGAGANVLVRAESRPAGLKAQQAQKPAVGAGDSGPPPPGCGHRPADFGQAGPWQHCAACEPSQRRSGSIKSLVLGDVITFHDSLQVPGRADDQRGVDVIVAEEVPYLTDSGGQRMSCGSREHHLGSGAQDLIHRSRIRTTVRTWSPAVPAIRSGLRRVFTGPSPLRQWTSTSTVAR